MICRDGSVGAAGQTAPTKGYESPLKIVSVVVLFAMLKIISKNFNALFSGKTDAEVSQHGAEEHPRNETWSWWRCEGEQEN